MEYIAGQELADGRWWLHDNDNLLDLATGYTATLALVRAGVIVEEFTVANGLSLATGEGVEPTGVPNLTIQWPAGALDITPGTYLIEIQVRRDSDNKDFKWQDTLRVIKGYITTA